MVLLFGLSTGAAGQSFGPPTELNVNAGTDSGDDYVPRVTTDGAENWVVVWHSSETLDGTIDNDYDILVARSVDYGATWTAPVALNTNADTDAGHDYVPQVTTDRAGNWVAVWHSNDSLGGTIGTDYDILVARSVDSGATWTAPVPLNTNAGTDSEGDSRPRVTTDGMGTWLAVWWSADNLGGTIGTDYDILLARSVDNGATWTAPAPLNTNAGTDSGHDWYPQITTDGAGNWVAVWHSRDSLGGMVGTDLDILVARSMDNGATWTAPAALNTNAGIDSGDDYVPQVTTDGVGSWVVVWESTDSMGGTIGTDYDILVARSVDNGATWTAPAPLNTNADTDSGDDYVPQVTTDGVGKWVAVWYSADDLGGTIGTDYDILVARSVDNGATWTAPTPLASNAGTDSGHDQYPRVTTDGAGAWVAVWASTDSMGGTIGTDYDILVAWAGTMLTSIDHFTCYRARDLKSPRFAATTVELVDQFGVNDGQFDVKRPFLICNPADRNNEGIDNPDDHLTCYRISGPRLKRSERPKVRVLNRFGAMQLEATKPFLLCVPSAKTVLP